MSHPHAPKISVQRITKKQEIKVSGKIFGIFPRPLTSCQIARHFDRNVAQGEIALHRRKAWEFRALRFGNISRSARNESPHFLYFETC